MRPHEPHQVRADACSPAVLLGPYKGRNHHQLRSRTGYQQMISLERAAELAQKYVDEDPLNSEVDLIPIEGYVAVVGEAAYFGYQTRGHLETGDPSQMAIGIGPIRVDLVTGECRMLGSLEAMDMDLFEVDEFELFGPGGWRIVAPEQLDAWRAAFDAELLPLPTSHPPVRSVVRRIFTAGTGWKTRWTKRSTGSVPSPTVGVSSGVPRATSVTRTATPSYRTTGGLRTTCPRRSR